MKKGFTLVELSIVLVIIGLLIGGILVGQSLIANAKMKRAVSELVQYQVMVKDFYFKFKGLPGDINGYKFWGDACGNNWTVNLLGTNLGCNGDGNGQITYNPSESGLFWRHMYFGGYIKQNLSQAWNVTVPTHVIGVNALSASVFYKDAMYFPNSGGINDFTIRVVRVNTVANDQPYTAAIPGEMMVAIDAKYDDGIPNTGIITGANGAYGNGYFQDNCLWNAGTYAFSYNPSIYNNTGCVMWAKFIAY